jgi:hypothetical protein
MLKISILLLFISFNPGIYAQESAYKALLLLIGIVGEYGFKKNGTE